MSNQKKIAVLGWGSLIWCPGSINKHIGEWHTGGPCLPIEFSRISGDKRLTLVIDETNGATIPTRFTESRLCDLGDTIKALAEREGIKSAEGIQNSIGFVDLQGTMEPHTPFLKSEVISEWVERNRFDAVVWTALKSNFKQKRKKVFTVGEAAKYLRKLVGKPQDTAREYIENAPPEVCTPLRSHLYTIGWLKA